MVAYGPVHRQIEHMLALAKNGVAGLSAAEQRERLIAALTAWNADPFSPGRDEHERTWRAEAAEKLIAPYEDLQTGTYEGVPDAVDAEASALLAGVSPVAPGPTITDAFKFYLKEKAKPAPGQRKKQEQRYGRAERNLIAAVGSDKAVADITRADARKWRDQRVAAGMSPATVRREKNDIHAVIQTAISELMTEGIPNPFHKIALPEARVNRQDQRLPLPPEAISGVYASLARTPDLLRIWTLLDLTGARPSEISQLTAGEIVLNHPVPHIVIQEREGRTLKTTWSPRQVPLVGEALDVAKAIIRPGTKPADPCFPRYFGEGGADRLSQALTKRLRKFTTDPRHVPYSLRHNMKDRLREALVPVQVQLALQGHSLGKGEEAAYRASKLLPQKRDGLLAALAGYRGVGKAG
jgi:integrase